MVGKVGCLTQTEPVGLVGEDHAEPAWLFTLESLTRGQQHLVVQKAATQQPFFFEGDLRQVLGAHKRGSEYS